MKIYYQLIFPVLLLVLITCGLVNAQNLNSFKLVEYSGNDWPIVQNKMRFNGYTRFWNDTYSNWYRYGNLFKMAVNNVSLTVAQNKVDIAEELGILGLQMKEGFINQLFETDATILNQPTILELETAATENDVLVYASSDSEVGKELLVLAGELNQWKKDFLHWHQVSYL